MFGKHAAYIIPSYGITLVIGVILVAWIIVTYRKRLNEIRKLEEKGIKRGAKSAEKDV